MKVFVSPHNDDETLFGAFTLLREAPAVVVVIFDGHVQAGRGLDVSWKQRRLETRRACRELGCARVEFCGFRDDENHMRLDQIRDRIGELLGGLLLVNQWFVPKLEVDGHKQHNLVASAFDGLQNVTRYLTYTGAGKSRSANEVKIERPEWIKAKLLALAQYDSQMSLDPRMGCWPHFVNDLREYYAE